MDNRKSVSSIMIGGACLLNNGRFQDSGKGIQMNYLVHCSPPK
jgi:hypothetical protein